MIVTLKFSQEIFSTRIEYEGWDYRGRYKWFVYFLATQEPKDGRVVFILPYLYKTLVGTTEVSQSLTEKTACTKEEREYLLNIYNSNFQHQISDSNVSSEFSGLRPIVASHVRPKESYFSVASREAAVKVFDKLITVYGGKWTSAPSLSHKVVRKIKN